MSAIGADTDQLRSVAQHMRSAAEGMQNELARIVATAESLDATWHGAAHDRYRQLWQAIRPNYPIAADYLTTFAEQLDELAAKLDKQRPKGLFGKIVGAITDVVGFVGDLLGPLTSLAGIAMPGMSLLKVLPNVLSGNFNPQALGQAAGGVPGAESLLAAASTPAERGAPAQAGPPTDMTRPSGKQYAVDTALASGGVAGEGSVLGMHAQGSAEFVAGEARAGAWYDPNRQAAGVAAEAVAFRAQAQGSIGNEHFGAAGQAMVEGPSARAAASASWDLENPYARAEAEAVLGRASASGELHSDYGSLAGHAHAEGPGASAGVAVAPGQLEARAGVSAGTAGVGGSVSVLGQEIGGGIEVGAKLELGVSLGEKTALHLPFVSLEASGPLADLVPGMNALKGLSEGFGAIKDIGEGLVSGVESLGDFLF